MRMISLAATPIAFFLPSRFSHINIGKLAFIGMLVTTFFLFTGGYVFPGGACHYPAWAEAIVQGTKLPPTIAQREIILPLLYILGGFPYFHSFIGITLIYALFAIFIGVLVYASIEKMSQTIAFYTGLACIVTLSPFTYMKFFYPDQAYIFFNLLACVLLIRFIQSKGNFKLLYLFTLAAIGASFTRTAGNLMFPVLLLLAYIMVRGRLRHYVSCMLIFVVAAGLYQWHRYDIFDMANHPIKPSGKGMQTIYPIYLYFKDFGLQLSPDLGPNMKRLDERLREELRPNVRDSAFIRKTLPSTPEWFKEKYIYAYTPDQLIHKLYTEPNEEYYCLLLDIAGDDDQFLLNMAKEIAKAHPWYIVQYSSRNLYHALFAPGYASTRFNTEGYLHTGTEFEPGSPSWGVNSADPVEQYGARATKEMQYFPVKSAPMFIQKIFESIKIFYLTHFDRYANLTSIFLIFAWVAAFLGIFSRFFSSNMNQLVKRFRIDEMTGPILIASAFVVYEALMTSVFCQPVYRYFHLTEPLRIIIIGFGVVFLVGLITLGRAQNENGLSKSGVVSVIQRYDALSTYFSSRRLQWYALLFGINVILFVCWVLSMISHTS